MRIAVIGAGSWGTTLANLLAGKGYEIKLWVREQELLSRMVDFGENVWFLPGIPLQSNLQLSSDLSFVISEADYILFVVPCQYIRSVLRQAKTSIPLNPAIICASKGIEIQSLKTMSQVINEELEQLNPSYAVLSGPSFAKEVSQGLPTAVSLGCADKELSEKLRDIFSTQNFRVYSNPDYLGVELGGSLKNIMAIAAGISDGLGFGTNARAALITRGLAEMARLGVALGAKENTFMGLSGLGDLVLTCTGELSRNRQIGFRLGQGENLSSIVDQMRMVAEGVKTTEAVYRLSLAINIELPITEQVYRILYEGKDPYQTVKELMSRELRQE